MTATRITNFLNEGLGHMPLGGRERAMTGASVLARRGIADVAVMRDGFSGRLILKRPVGVGA